MDRRGFLAALAGAAGARFFCPSGVHAAVQPAVAAPVVAEVVWNWPNTLTPMWIAYEALRLLANNLDDLEVDRLSLDAGIPRKLGDTLMLRRELEFKPWAPNSFVERVKPVTLQRQTRANFDVGNDEASAVSPQGFSQHLLEPAMSSLACRMRDEMPPARYGRSLLLSAPLEIPEWPFASYPHSGAVACCGSGLNLRMLYVPEMGTGFGRYRFDLLHGVAEL